MRRTALLTTLITALALVAAPAGAAPSVYPDVIPLPDGFQPEGITVGTGHEAYAGSLADGRVVRVDLRTGSTEMVVEPTGGPSVGMDFDDRSGYLFVAGGPTGTASVYDTDTGETVVTDTVGTGFVNDVIVTRTAAFFTNSFAAEIYRIGIGPAGEVDDAFETITLDGFDQVPGFNANGIEATPNGDTLIVVNSTTGELYTVDPENGDATQVDLGGDTVPAGDGIVLQGRTLYVVQNALDQVAVIELAPDLRSGVLTDTLTSTDFRIPTTADVFGHSLYAVNARFGVTPTPDTEYEIVRIDR